MCTTILSHEAPTGEYISEAMSDITNKLANIESLQRKALLEMSNCEEEKKGGNGMERQVVTDSDYNANILEMLSIIQGTYDSLVRSAALFNDPSVMMIGNNLMLKLPEVKINSFSDNSTNLFAFYQFKIRF